MYNLIKFINKYYIIFWFLLLELIAGIFIVQNNQYHKAGFINSANFFTGTFYSLYSKFTIYVDLKHENKKLATENAFLKNKITHIEYTFIPPLMMDSVSDSSALVLDSLILKESKQFQYIPTLVVSNSINKKFNYLYINKGLKDGIKPDMGIIEPNGVVGVVVNSSNHYSVVMPLINEKSSISIKLKRQEYFGTLKWESGNPTKAKMIEVPNHVNLKKGDTIITSGYSQIFPKDILVGFVESTAKIEGSSFLDIHLKLSVDFAKLNHTYAVQNLESEELKSLIIE
jgi:rod shape-determining protein MreC